MNRKKTWIQICCSTVFFLAVAAHYIFEPWGFYHKVSQPEAEKRLSLVAAAEAYLGANEADGSYRVILERYNAQPVLPQGYALQDSDSWCAAFVTVAAMDAGLSQRIPPECGCQRQIGLWQGLGSWQEDDGYIPQPGDVIYYDFDENRLRDCTGWSDHVGIVVGVKWPFIKVIEGNWSDAVCSRVLFINDIHIRGYGLPPHS